MPDTPIEDPVDVGTALDLIDRAERGNPPTAMCPSGCGEPLVSTFERAGAEFHCLGCGGWFGFLAPKPADTTPDLEARRDQLRALFDKGWRGPRDDLPAQCRFVLAELDMTCVACPSQWEGTDADGSYVYVRYRHGRLTVDRAPDKDEWFSSASGFDAHQVLAAQLVPPDAMGSGELGEDEMLALTGLRRPS